MSLKEKALARQPKATPVAEIAEIPEVEATLFQAANGNRRNQFRGRLDEAGTVRVRVYAPGDADEHRGEILVGSIDADATKLDTMKGQEGEIVKVEFDGTLAKNTLVIMWAPADADIEGVKVLL